MNDFILSLPPLPLTILLLYDIHPQPLHLYLYLYSSFPEKRTTLHYTPKSNPKETLRYHESIFFLYTLPTLEFSNPWTLPYLLPTIPPSHRDRIRKIELRWSFPGHWLPSKDSVRAVYVSAGRTQWTETCRAVSQLRSLRSFVLVLESNWFSEPVEKLVGFLEPLSGVIVRSGLRQDWDRERDCGGKKDYVGVGVDVEIGFHDGFSSDEDSCRSLGSDSGSFSSVGGYATTTTTTTTTMASGSRGSWELRLQGQCYYSHELDRIGVDLRRKGIDCWISAV